jgi:glycosyltransferase involved in cell wall biosynthesis
MGDAAEYVDPHSVDSIREGIDIIYNKERLDELSELGRRQAKKYTWEKSTKRLIDVFCSVGSLDERNPTTLSR